MRNEKRTWIAWLATVCLAVFLGQCSSTPQPVIRDGTPVPGGVGRVVNLEQGWSEDEQQWFWFTSQGSQIILYDWFLALEQAGNTELFRSAANLNRLRYLVETPTRLNPDGLPVGFAKDVDERTKEQWMGWTCAACHTNQVEYRGTALRIDGGPTMADASTFLSDLVAAMRATVDDNEKFDRFARKVLGRKYDPGNANALRRALFDRTEVLDARVEADHPRTPYGFARLDAFGGIFNQVLGADLDLPANYELADAPVSYPFLWDTPQCDRVQWNGIASNVGVGPLARNVGEILGVFGAVDIDPKAIPPGYQSSIRFLALGELERTLDKLQSPLWPMEYLPAIDPVLAEKGKGLYVQHCARCHTLIDRTDREQEITVTMTKLSDIGTDPTMAENVVNRMAKTGRLEGTRELILVGDRFGPEASGGTVLANVVLGTILAHPVESLEAAIEEYMRERPSKEDLLAYKGRPLNGIWATAPYLHNGSVPNLWELLQPEGERVKEFYVGSREFDPKNVGFVTAPFPGGFRFDATQTGNSNAGHTFGTHLEDEERWALIEFMKSL